MNSITCPHCKKTSYSQGDIDNKYCGNCNQYHDKFKLKENSEDPCKYCGSFKYTQTLSEKVGVICQKCLLKTLDSALDDVMAKMEANAKS